MGLQRNVTRWATVTATADLSWSLQMMPAKHHGRPFRTACGVITSNFFLFRRILHEA